MKEKRTYIKTMNTAQIYTHSAIQGETLIFSDMVHFINDLQIDLSLVAVVWCTNLCYESQVASTGAVTKWETQLSFSPVFSAEELTIAEHVVSAEIRSTATPAIDSYGLGFTNQVIGNFKNEIVGVTKHEGISVAGSQVTTRVEAPAFKGSAVFINGRSRRDFVEGAGVPQNRVTIRCTLFFEKL